MLLGCRGVAYTSDFVVVQNGVKQGGVASPVLVCIYTDDLLLRLADSGVGCFVGFTFVGAVAYADDIVLIAPTPSAMRKLLMICYIYAAEYNIQRRSWPGGSWGPDPFPLRSAGRLV